MEGYDRMASQADLEEELDIYKSRLERAMDAGNIAWWEMELPSGAVQFNDRKAEMLGYSPDRFSHYEDFTDLVHPEEYEQAMQAMRDHLEGEAERYETEYRLRQADGEYRWFRDLGAITERGEDGYLKVAGIVIDIDERKRQERELRRKTKRLEEFASVISHDLRNPLNVAEGHLELLREACEDEAIESMADALDRMEAIEGALDRMESIIDDTLTLARKGDSVGEMETVVLEDVIRDCWDMVETDAATVEVREEMVIRADRDRLEHVLENLFRNAIDHAREDVTVRIGRLGDTGFYVEDDGPGIPESKRTDVFEPGHSTASGNTGFGLAIVKRIAEAHGWDVAITEGSDGGARFEFTGVNMIS